MEKQLKKQYLISSDKWHKSSSVRNSNETYELPLNKQEGKFNEDLNWSIISCTPILNHSLLKNLSDKDKRIYYRDSNIRLCSENKKI